MIFEEFKHLKQEHDKNNPFSNFYFYETGESFYVEPAFYTQLMGFKEQHKERFSEILKRMEEVVKSNKKVVFTANYETPLTEAEGYIYLEITDITDPLKIYAEDKSRGSDYGD